MGANHVFEHSRFWSAPIVPPLHPTTTFRKTLRWFASSSQYVPWACCARRSNREQCYMKFIIFVSRHPITRKWRQLCSLTTHTSNIRTLLTIFPAHPCEIVQWWECHGRPSCSSEAVIFIIHSAFLSGKQRNRDKNLGRGLTGAVFTFIEPVRVCVALFCKMKLNQVTQTSVVLIH